MAGVLLTSWYVQCVLKRGFKFKILISAVTNINPELSVQTGLYHSLSQAISLVCTVLMCFRYQPDGDPVLSKHVANCIINS
jgi:hypothetical protein